MKLLILSCDTGDGSPGAALALCEAAEERGIDCVMADPDKFGRGWTKSAVIYSGKKLKKSIPRLYRAVYSASGLLDKAGITSPLYYANATYAEELADYIKAEGFDAVISTHLHGMEAMTAVRRRTGLSVPAYGVLTEYAYVPLLSETDLNFYFMPHKGLAPKLMDKGVGPDRSRVTGIPVDRRFSRGPTRAEARNFLVIPKKKRVYVINSMGLKPSYVSNLCEYLAGLEKKDALIYVLADRESELYEKLSRKLKKKLPDEPMIQTAAYSERENFYIAAADVAINAADGVLCARNAALGTPMVLPHTVSGTESGNAEFLAKREFCLKAKSAWDCALKARRLLDDRAEAHRMVSIEKMNAFSDAADTIIDHITEGKEK